MNLRTSILTCLLLASTTAFAKDPDLVPLPAQMILMDGEFTVVPQTRIIFPQGEIHKDLADYLNQYIGGWFGTPLTVEEGVASTIRGDYISLAVDPRLLPDGVRLRMPAEGYKLKVTRRGVEITGVDRAGLFYGIQTFLQLLPPDIYKCKPSNGKLNVRLVDITDWPQFTYRGMMLDVARTFVKKDEVMRFIERLAYHKINRLHWHLTDDEGWRIEIKSYPELAKKGGFRGVGLPVMPYYGSWDKPYGGYYTQDEIREIVQFAAMRNIEIIPEVEFPGHSRALAQIRPDILCPGKADTEATAGYDRRNVWCASKESNYAMIGKILAEVCDLFPSEYIHIGGDEVLRGQWLSCPSCRKMANKNDIQPIQDYFTSRLAAILAQNGKKMAAWDEAAQSGAADKSTLISGWQSVQSCLDATAKGYKTVVMPGRFFYFDMKQSPWEDGLTWAAVTDTHRNYAFDFEAQGFTAQNMENVAGVEGTFFSELLLSHEGTPYLDYQCYPRICSLSEIAWTQPRLRGDEGFHGRLYNTHFDRLGAMGIAFRLPPPEGLFADGNITALAHHRHTGIRFTDDGTQPTKTSALYCCAMYDDNIERYRFCEYVGDNQSATVPVTIRRAASISPKSSIVSEIPLPRKPGLWCLRIRSSEPDVVIRSMQVVADTSYYIIRSEQKVNELHQMRFYATSATYGGKMHISLRNDSPLPATLSLQWERSRYIEPAVTVTSTMSANVRYPYSRAADYNFSTYGRTARTCRKGDMITYTFAAPVECQSIEVRTGFTFLPRQHVPLGTVETSPDGENFYEAGKLRDGGAVINPSRKVKAVRIVSAADGNGDAYVLIQDLKIIPKYGK